MVRTFVLALAAAGALLASGCATDRGRGGGVDRAALAAMPVNPYLWRAALDTLAFASPQGDPATGTLRTGWHVPPHAPNERLQVTVHVLDRALRADALRVSAARQVNRDGQWVDAPVAAATVQRLEEIILTRAQALHRAAGL